MIERELKVDPRPGLAAQRGLRLLKKRPRERLQVNLLGRLHRGVGLVIEHADAVPVLLDPVDLRRERNPAQHEITRGFALHIQDLPSQRDLFGLDRRKGKKPHPRGLRLDPHRRRGILPEAPRDLRVERGEHGRGDLIAAGKVRRLRTIALEHLVHECPELHRVHRPPVGIVATVFQDLREIVPKRALQVLGELRDADLCGWRHDLREPPLPVMLTARRRGDPGGFAKEGEHPARKHLLLTAH